MTRKEQNKILHHKIESNVNQYKVDRLNAEISAFSSGDLNKYEFLTRKDLKYKRNALDKARFEFSPLGKMFSTGLDKTAQVYQEEGVIKLLKDIRDGLRGGVNRPNDDNNDNNDNNNDDNNDDDDHKIEEETAKRTEDFYEQLKDNYDDIIKNLKDKMFDLEKKVKDSELSNEEKDKLNNDEKDKTYKILNKFKDNMKENIDNFDKTSNDYLDIFDNKISTLNDKIFKIKDTIKNNKILTNVEKNELQNKIEIINKEKKELQENIEKIIFQKNYINNEYRKSVNIIRKHKESKKYEDNLETMEMIKKLEEDLKSSHESFDVVTTINTDNLEKMKKMEEDLENAYKTIDIFTNNKYDPNGFDIYGNHKDTSNKYDPNGFDREVYNVNGLDRNGLDRHGIKGTK